MSDQPPMPPVPTGPVPSGPRPSVGLAISWAFDRFKTHAAAFIGLAAIVTVLQFAERVSTQPLVELMTNCTDTRTPGQINACAASIGASLLISSLIFLVFGLLIFFAQIGVQRAAIRSSQGITPTFSEMLTTENLGKYVLFTIVYVALCVAGLVLCILPLFAVIFLLQLGPYYVLDKGYTVGEAIKASFNAVTKNFGPALLMTLFNFLVVLLGSAFFGILTLLTLPFAALFTTHMYRQFNHETIS